MTQSRFTSLIESVFDVFLGFVIYLPINFLVLPYFVDGISNYDIFTMLQISVIFTSIAVARKFIVRRWFISKDDSI